MIFALQQGYLQTINSLVKGDYTRAAKQADALFRGLVNLPETSESKLIAFDVLYCSITANYLSGNVSGLEGRIEEFGDPRETIQRYSDYGIIEEIVRYGCKDLYPSPFISQPTADNDLGPVCRILALANLEDYATLYHKSLRQHEKFLRKGKAFKVDHRTSIDVRLDAVNSYVENELRPRYQVLRQRDYEEIEKGLELKKKMREREFEKAGREAEKIYRRPKKLIF